ncbi:MAG: NPCBM/NEW2 domain-containing protein [Planctomycetota bacterium]
MANGIAAAAALFLFATAATGQGGVRLQDLDLSRIDQAWGNPRAGRSVEGRPISIGGVAFERGVGTHADSEWTIELGGKARSFTASVGVDDEARRGTVVFVVLVDGREAYRSPIARGGEMPRRVEVDLAGASRLTLLVEDAGDGIDYDHADWADPVIAVEPGCEDRVKSGRIDETTLPIAMGRDEEPRLNYPRIVGASPGKPFLFRIPASGRPPLRFSAVGLPRGLALDPARGILSGTVEEEGRLVVSVEIEGPLGTSSGELTLVFAPGALCLTPPMGWNSWNCWGLSVDNSKVRAAAAAFDRSGLAAHGFRYVNIDDGWEGGRDENGTILPNEKFKDMRALADYVHGLGLLLGIYSSPGPKTCGGFEGSYGHEEQDARTYAEWGIDYLKYDWCSYSTIAPNPDLAAMQRPYLVMRDALRALPRDIVYSLCQYGMGRVHEWGAEVGGNCWRTTGDITDLWSSMSRIGFRHDEMVRAAGPGHWNDPDMLVVGSVGWGPDLHPTRLTRNEQITHVTLWSMLAAPLLIGCDLDRLDDFTLALLTNDDVIAIDQDPLGRAARRHGPAGPTEVWVRPLADGSSAVALFNRSRGTKSVRVEFALLGMRGPCAVRNCWTRKDEPEPVEAYEAEIPRHGALLLRVGKPGKGP